MTPSVKSQSQMTVCKQTAEHTVLPRPVRSEMLSMDQHTYSKHEYGVLQADVR